MMTLPVTLLLAQRAHGRRSFSSCTGDWECFPLAMRYLARGATVGRRRARSTPRHHSGQLPTRHKMLSAATPVSCRTPGFAPSNNPTVHTSARFRPPIPSSLSHKL
eukprot:83096-Chlamydomonas_euryale.AAC.3